MYAALRGLICLASGAVLGAVASADQPALTIYNQDFGVVRERIKLDLKAGSNFVQFSDTTAHLEPDSVLLRDPAGKRRLTVIEQNYRNDPVSQERLLALYEGKEIEFEVGIGEGKTQIKKGKIIRSGYVPHVRAWSRYGPPYMQQQMAYGGEQNAPIIEIDGRLRFGLPGLPIFPSLRDDTVLKPTISWNLETDSAGPLDAELAYVTGGMTWNADYNVLAPEVGDTLDLRGWVTIDNQSGRSFNDATIKLMAGDVQKLAPRAMREAGAVGYARRDLSAGADAGPTVTEKSFDEYHLYTLERSTTLRDSETKQVEFVSADGVKSERIYVYEGASLNDSRWANWYLENLREQPDYGVRSNPKVWVMREFKNCVESNLNLPLPAGRVRIYRKDTDGRAEFVGEGDIDHTPVGEKVRIYSGNAFDIVGERVRRDFRVDGAAHWADESFSITLRNHKKEPVEIRVVERLYRWSNWEILEKSQDFTKMDSQTIEFRLKVDPEKDAQVSYKVHYSW